jgi:predicted kinase
MLAKLKKSTDDFHKQIRRQKSRRDDMIEMLKHYDAPTVDVYFELKVCQQQYQKREKEMERKKNIERLKKINEKTKERKKGRQQLSAKRATFCPKKTPARNIRLGSPCVLVGQVFKGATFDIVFKPPN